MVDWIYKEGVWQKQLSYSNKLGASSKGVKRAGGAGKGEFIRNVWVSIKMGLDTTDSFQVTERS